MADGRVDSSASAAVYSPPADTTTPKRFPLTIVADGSADLGGMRGHRFDDPGFELALTDYLSKNPKLDAALDADAKAAGAKTPADIQAAKLMALKKALVQGGLLKPGPLVDKDHKPVLVDGKPLWGIATDKVSLPGGDAALALAPKPAPGTPKDGADATVAKAPRPITTSVLPPPPKSLGAINLGESAKTAERALADSPEKFGHGVHGFKTEEERAALFDTMLSNYTPDQLTELETKLPHIRPEHLGHELEKAIEMRRAQLPGGALEGVTSQDAIGKYREFIGLKDHAKWVKELGITDADINAWLTAPPGSRPPESIMKAITAMQTANGKTSLVPEVNVMLKLMPMFAAHMRTRTGEDPKVQDAINWATDVNKNIGQYAYHNRVANGGILMSEGNAFAKAAASHTKKAEALRAAGKYDEAKAEDAKATHAKEMSDKMLAAGRDVYGHEAAAKDAQIAKMGERAPPWLRAQSTALNAHAATAAGKLGDSQATAVEASFESYKANNEGPPPDFLVPNKLPDALGDKRADDKGLGGGAQYYLGQARAFNGNYAKDPDYLGAEASVSGSLKTHSERYLKYNGYPPEPPADPNATPVSPTVNEHTKELRKQDVNATITLRDNVTHQIAILKDKPKLSSEEREQLRGLTEQEKNLSMQVASWSKQATDAVGALPEFVTAQDKLQKNITAMQTSLSAADQEISELQSQVAQAKKDADSVFASTTANEDPEFAGAGYGFGTGDAAARDQNRYASLQRLIQAKIESRDDLKKSLADSQVAYAANVKRRGLTSSMHDIEDVTTRAIRDSNPNANLGKDGTPLGPNINDLLKPGLDAAEVAKQRLMPGDLTKLKPEERADAGSVALSNAAFDSGAARLMHPNNVIMPSQAAVDAKNNAVASLDYAQNVYAGLPADSKDSSVKGDFGKGLVRTESQVAVDIARTDPTKSKAVIDQATVNTRDYRGNEPLHNALVDVVYGASGQRMLVLAGRDKQQGPDSTVDNATSDALQTTKDIAKEYDGKDYDSDTKTRTDATVKEVDSWPAKQKEAIENFKKVAAHQTEAAKAEAMWHEIGAVDTTEGAISVLVDVASLGIFEAYRESTYTDRMNEQMQKVDDAYAREIAGYDQLENYIDSANAKGQYSMAMGLLQNYNAPRAKDSLSQQQQLNAFAAKYGLTDVDKLTSFCVFSKTMRGYVDGRTLNPSGLLEQSKNWHSATNSTQENVVGEAQVLDNDMKNSWEGKYGTLIVAGGELVVGTILTAGAADLLAGSAEVARVAGALKRIQGVARALEVTAAISKAAPLAYRIGEAYLILKVTDVANEQIGGRLFSSRSVAGKAFAFSTQMIGARASNSVFKLTTFGKNLFIPGLQFFADQIVIPNVGLTKEQQEHWHTFVKYAVPLLGVAHGAFASGKEARAATHEGIEQFNKGLPEGTRLNHEQSKALENQLIDFDKKASFDLSRNAAPSQKDYDAHAAALKETLTKANVPPEAVNAFLEQQAAKYVAASTKNPWHEGKLPSVDEAAALTDKVATDLQKQSPKLSRAEALAQAQGIVLDKMQALKPPPKSPKELINLIKHQQEVIASVDKVAADFNSRMNSGAVAEAAMKGANLPEAAQAIVREQASAQAAAMRAETPPTPEAARALLAEGDAKLTTELQKTMPKAEAEKLAHETCQRLALASAEESGQRLAMLSAGDRAPPAALTAQAFELQAHKLGLASEVIAERRSQIYGEERANEILAGVPSEKRAAVKDALAKQLSTFEAAEAAGEKPNLGEMARELEHTLLVNHLTSDEARTATKAAVGEFIGHRALNEATGQPPGLNKRAPITTPEAETAYVRALGDAIKDVNLSFATGGLFEGGGGAGLYGYREAEQMQAVAVRQLIGNRAAPLIEAKTKALGRPLTPAETFACYQEASGALEHLPPGSPSREAVVADMAYDLATAELASTPEGRSLLADEKKVHEVEQKIVERAKALGVSAADERDAIQARNAVAANDERVPTPPTQADEALKGIVADANKLAEPMRAHMLEQIAQEFADRQAALPAEGQSSADVYRKALEHAESVIGVKLPIERMVAERAAQQAAPSVRDPDEYGTVPLPPKPVERARPEPAGEQKLELRGDKGERMKLVGYEVVVNFPDGLSAADRATFAEQAAKSLGIDKTSIPDFDATVAKGESPIRLQRQLVADSVAAEGIALRLAETSKGAEFYKDTVAKDGKVNRFEGKCRSETIAWQKRFAESGVFVDRMNAKNADHRWLTDPGGNGHPRLYIDPTFGQFFNGAAVDLGGGHTQYEPFVGTYNELKARLGEGLKRGVVADIEGEVPTEPKALDAYVEKFIADNWGIKAGGLPEGVAHYTDDRLGPLIDTEVPDSALAKPAAKVDLAATIAPNGLIPQTATDAFVVSAVKGKGVEAPARIAHFTGLEVTRLSPEALGASVVPPGEEGSSGDVVKAKVNGKDVVVKVYRQAPDAHQYALFVREVRAAKVMSDLGIGPKFEGIVDLGDGRLAFAMEQINGVASEHAGKAIQDHTVAELGAAIDALHAQGIDIRDFQYFVTPDGHVRIIDGGGVQPYDPQHPSILKGTQIRMLREAALGATMRGDQPAPYLRQEAERGGSNWGGETSQAQRDAIVKIVVDDPNVRVTIAHGEKTEIVVAQTRIAADGSFSITRQRVGHSGEVWAPETEHFSIDGTRLAATPTAPREAFPSQAKVETDAFDAEARSMGVPAQAIAHLYDFGGGNVHDATTGLQTGEARLASVTRAIERVRMQPGDRAYYLEGDIRNLGGLNNAMGEAAANALFKKQTDIFVAELRAVGADAEFFRHGGDEVSGLIVANGLPPEVVAAAVKRAQSKIAEMVAKETYQVVEGGVTVTKKVSDLPHLKHPDEPAFNGTGMTIAFSEVAGDASPAEIFAQADRAVEAVKSSAGLKSSPDHRLPPAGTVAEPAVLTKLDAPPARDRSPDLTSPPNRKHFLTDVELRRSEFVAEAGKYGISEAKANQLFRLAKGETVDNVTGFGKPTARARSIERAGAHIAANPSDRAFYVSGQVRNLAGANSVLGHTGANEVFSTQTAIFAEELRSIGADVEFVHQGGPNVSAIIVGHGLPECIVRAALERAQQRIDVMFESGVIHTASGKTYKLADVGYPKDLQNKALNGGGMAFGVAEISGHHPNVPEVFQRAEQEISAALLDPATATANMKAVPPLSIEQEFPVGSKQRVERSNGDIEWWTVAGYTADGKVITTSGFIPPRASRPESMRARNPVHPGAEIKIKLADGTSEGGWKVGSVNGDRVLVFKNGVPKTMRLADLDAINNAPAVTSKPATPPKPIEKPKPVPPPNIPRLQSDGYQSRNRIDRGVPIADGFYDGGRGMQTDAKGHVTSPREILIVDRAHDPQLRKWIKEAQKLRKLPEQERLVKLAQLVYTELSPRDKNLKSMAVFEKWLPTKENQPLLIGEVKGLGAGVCRHKSLLFKVLADEAGLQTALVRGFAEDDSGAGGHAWNEVTLANGKTLVVDPTNPANWEFPEVGQPHPNGMRYSDADEQPLYGWDGE